MQWSLVLLVLLGQHSLFAHQLFEYHFIPDSKTWDEAQKYCKVMHTDLVTVYNETDINKLPHAAEGQDAWTGLYNKPESNGTKWNWRWSQAGVEYNKHATKWKQGEPNNVRENCVSIYNAAKVWSDNLCTRELGFICYNAEKTTDEFHVSEGPMSWPKAQSFCRESHTDLISGSQLDKLDFSGKEADHWIGLYRDVWRWSDGSSSLFRPWNETFPDNQQYDNQCATLDKDGRWNADNCSFEKPFLCYKDNVILIKENKTWEEAINYCRQNHNDLISITGPEQQRWVQERAKNASSSHVWLALRFTCILEVWFWVTDERVKYKNWASNVKADDCNMSGAMQTTGEHKWSKEDDMKKFNFFCSTF